ncbi:ISOC1 (predicted) [Pycnogonum litorale]
MKIPKLHCEKTIFFLCDMQEKFSGVIKHFPAIVENSKKLIECGKILSIPLFVTEQYPEKLGPTVKELDIKHASCVCPKTLFSMMTQELKERTVKALDCDKCSVVLFGIETHVCVEQTALDLIEKNVSVHVVADATSSRSQEDRTLAFQRLRDAGCFIETSESIIFKLLKDKNHPSFNEIRGLVKQSSRSTDL